MMSDVQPDPYIDAIAAEHDSEYEPEHDSEYEPLTAPPPSHPVWRNPALNARPRLVGLDLSLTSTGVAAIGHHTARVTTITPGGTGHPRLRKLLSGIWDHACRVDLAVIEGPSFGSKGGQQHERGGLWWLVAHMLWEAGIPYVVISPAQVKKYATGYGGGVKSGKDKVLAAVIRRYPDVPVDGNDQADALVLAAMAADHYGHPLAPVPQLNRGALATVKGWPDLDLAAGTLRRNQEAR
jgi:crossover junction endodeoxyribonuclease RuvC